MKIDLSEATHIEVEAEVRYWEDARVNGVIDEDGSRIFGREGNLWKVRIDLLDGIVQDWPAGDSAEIHYKVCDQGLYWLTDASGNRLAKWRGHYVPNDFLCHGSEGFGDYIILNVAVGGGIEGYCTPRINLEQWEVLASTGPAALLHSADCISFSIARPGPCDCGLAEARNG